MRNQRAKKLRRVASALCDPNQNVKERVNYRTIQWREGSFKEVYKSLKRRYLNEISNKYK